MGWLIELLVEGMREKCSQFIVDMMDVVTEVFMELLSCDLDLFEELFGVVGELYKNVVVPLSIALLLLICVWQLFKSMFGKMGVNSEDPFELVCRSGFCLFMIAGAKAMVNYVLEIAGTPYQWVVGMDVKVSSFSEYVTALEGVTSALGIDNISVSLLMLIMQFVVAWNYFKMLFMVAERYVLLGVFSYTAPLALSTGGSKATNSILASWAKMFGGQVVLIIMNAWCMKMFESGYGNLMASGYGFTKFFVATLCLIGFCKITFKLDSYMASLGVNLGRPSGGMGAMGLLMAAGRIFSHVGRSGSGSGDGASESGDGGDGASAAAGTQDMAQGMGGPIPMSTDGMGMEADGEESEIEDVFGSVSEDDPDMQGADMEEMEDENVLEALGEMPIMEDGEEEDFDGNAFSDGEGWQDMGCPPSDSELDAEEAEELDAGMLSDGESSIPEMYGGEECMDGPGDYPVNREKENEEEEGAEAEMDLDGSMISEETGAGDVSAGGAGTAFDGRTSLAGNHSRGSGEEPGDAGILSELGMAMESLPMAGGSETRETSGQSGEMGETGGLQWNAGETGKLPRTGAWDNTNGTGDAWDQEKGEPIQNVFDEPVDPSSENHLENHLESGRADNPGRQMHPSDSSGEIPRVPESREELKRWKNRNPDNGDDLAE